MSDDRDLFREDPMTLEDEVRLLRSRFRSLKTLLEFGFGQNRNRESSAGPMFESDSETSEVVTLGRSNA